MTFKICGKIPKYFQINQYFTKLALGQIPQKGI